MRRGSRRIRTGDTSGQLQIEWNATAGGLPAAVSDQSPGTIQTMPVQRLPWDFRTTFPPPTDEAIDAGILSDEDTTPEGIASIHGEHARELLAALHDLDAVLDARRQGVDAATGRTPRTPAATERLTQFFASEPPRLERWWQTLIETYETAFGAEASDAFGKAVRAWHAGVEVVAPAQPMAAPNPTPPASLIAPREVTNPRPHRPDRIHARLPVPRPLPSAVAAGQFGREENGKPVRPGAQEIREITEQHAEKLIGLLESLTSVPLDGKQHLLESFQTGLRAYAEDFGQGPAEQLEAYVRRQAGLDPSRRRSR